MARITSRILKRGIPAALALMALTGAAEAHTGIGSTMGFTHGLLHPLSGIDHILAMVGVGLFAARLGGKALWLVPLTFVLMMAMGGVLGMNGFALPYVEFGIAASVLVLGAMVALDFSLPVSVAMALVGFFALFHGHAHGAEMPMEASGYFYGAGFITATALLHAAGIALGISLMSFTGKMAPRIAKVIGALMALAGVGLLMGYL